MSIVDSILEMKRQMISNNVKPCADGKYRMFLSTDDYLDLTTELEKSGSFTNTARLKDPVDAFGATFKPVAEMGGVVLYVAP